MRNWKGKETSLSLERMKDWDSDSKFTGGDDDYLGTEIGELG